MASIKDRVFEKDKLVLFCKHQGSTPIFYSWLKDGHILNKTEDTLLIPSIERSQSGQYKCIVINPLGNKESLGHNVTVLCKWKIIPLFSKTAVRRCSSK